MKALKILIKTDLTLIALFVIDFLVLMLFEIDQAFPAGIILAGITAVFIFFFCAYSLLFTKKKDRTRLFYATHIMNLLWIIGVLFIISNIKIMGSPIW